MTEKDIVSWNSMISGLVKVGDLGRARKLFDEMSVKDIVNTILDGCTKTGEMNQTFELFKKMPEQNVVSWLPERNVFCNGMVMEVEDGVFETKVSNFIYFSPYKSLFWSLFFCTLFFIYIFSF